MLIPPELDDVLHHRVKENDPETLVADAGRFYLKVSVRGFDEVTY